MTEHVSGNVQRISPNSVPFVLQIGENHKITTYVKDLTPETVRETLERLGKFVDELDFSTTEEVAIER